MFLLQLPKRSQSTACCRRCRHRYFGLDSVSESLWRSAVEIALEFGATRDYRSRPFLQLALCSFEECPEGARSCVASHRWSWPLPHVPVCLIADKRWSTPH